MVPGRTMSPPTSFQRTIPAEFAIERGYGSPLHACSNVESCSLIPSSSSARARCVMSRSAATESQWLSPSSSAVTAGAEPLARRRPTAGPPAEPVHPGVDLEEDLERTLEMRVLEHRDLVRV